MWAAERRRNAADAYPPPAVDHDSSPALAGRASPLRLAPSEGAGQARRQPATRGGIPRRPQASADHHAQARGVAGSDSIMPVRQTIALRQAGQIAAPPLHNVGQGPRTASSLVNRSFDGSQRQPTTSERVPQKARGTTTLIPPLFVARLQSLHDQPYAISSRRRRPFSSAGEDHCETSLTEMGFGRAVCHPG